MRKDEARAQKEADKKDSDEKTAVFTMDMQAVLLSPSLNASALYYRTKLKIHNFSIYNLKDKEGYCYLWDESEGGLNADEFSSIIGHFVMNEVDSSKYNHIIFYSDGCTYQNSSSILANTLILVSKKNRNNLNTEVSGGGTLRWSAIICIVQLKNNLEI